ncbi:MAG TPA: HVO_0476 family zinc finger protein, partial [Methanomicrobiales archaeon]|nr:HVO_0476 family zinc finger protein [Methanomicrobiales archaeon]
PIHYKMAITFVCPSCGEECDHEVVGTARNPVVRCTACGHTYRGVPAREEEVSVRAIVSREGESQVCSVPLESGEAVAVGDLLAAECGEEVFGVEVTSIESKGKRVKRAKARDVSALWTRAIDQVVVRASVHSGRVTRPLAVACGGDEEFFVDEEWTFGTIPFRITHMKLRDGKVLRKEGQKAPARMVKRIYGNRL